MTINSNRFMVKNGLDNNSKTITNVADPVNAQDAATRAYVLANAGSSISITDDTATNSAHYLTLTTATSGTISSAKVSSSKLQFNPSTGVFSINGGSSATKVFASGSSTDTAAYYNGAAVAIQNTSVTANNFTALRLVTAGGNDYAAIWGICSSHTNGSATGSLVFGTTNAAGASGERLRIGASGQIGIGGANYGTAGQAIVSSGSAAAPYWGLPISISSTRSTWSTNGTISACVGQLAWKNFGNGHSIFDASAGTSPDGGAVNSTNSAVAWTASYPTLMGWNGSQTYGVRVDSARLADSATTAANYLPLAGGTMSGNITMAPGGTTRGLLYADAGAFGLLNSSAGWALQIPTGTSNVTCFQDLSVAGNSYINGILTVGNGQSNSSITMYDSDEGNRSFHCNSNNIGFLTQAGGWGSYCTDDGSWYSSANMVATGSMTANSMYVSNWFRSTGDNGWFSQTYGGGIYMTDSLYVRLYNNKSFVAHSYVEVANNYGTVSGAVSIDPRNGSMVSMTLNGATTFTFTGAPSAGYAASFTLELTNGAAFTITWPTGTKWAAGIAPTLTGSGTDILSFYTRDGGTTWRGVLVSKDNR